ncbi:MAG: phosphate-selective porin O and P [Gammaproteobacteria bacterium]|nr:phosphate-selective porin O and P [Gammaproteobacteria bacterium]
MKHLFKTAAIALACTAGMAASTNTFAANWLMLQGTEPESAASRAYLWGFIQAQYQYDTSDPDAAGNLIPPKLIGPDLTSQSQFNVNRARIGVRGVGMPIDPKVNYFILAELGNNAITAANGGGAYITDASVTLNHIKGARIRMGLFKTPGVEEGLQAIHTFDYVNFTTVTNQLMLERYPNSGVAVNGTANTGVPIDTSGSQNLNQFNGPVGAFRDVGFQIFDAFNIADWEYSYAWMMGNGNGLSAGDNDENKDTYVYLSAEQIYGGKGPRREGMKMFLWAQNGKRVLDVGAGPVEHDRKRSGIGFKYLKKPFRATVEYMKGEGMIFQGPDKPTFDVNGPGAGGDAADADASGWYVEGGYYLTGTPWQFDIRYDSFTRMEGDANITAGPAPLIGKNFEMTFDTITLGMNYNFNKKTRMTFNVSDTTAEATAFPAGAGPNAQLEGIDKRYALQMTHIF